VTQTNQTNQMLEMVVLAKALHPQDVAEMILYIAKLPSRATIPEIQMMPAEE